MRDTVVEICGSIEDAGLEAQAPEYVRRYASLPVPEVYDYYSMPGNGAHLTVEFIEGERLDCAWLKITLERQDLVAKQLGVYPHKLRTLAQPKSPMLIWAGLETLGSAD